MTRRPLLLCCLVAVSALLAAGCDWAQPFAGPAHTSTSADTSISRAAITGGQVALRWTAPGGGSGTVVSGGHVYRSSGADGVQTYDAKGNTGCAGVPRTCSALWANRPGDGDVLGDPLVAGGKLLASDLSGHVHAFDAAGVSGCTGSPVVCAPVWSTAASGIGTTGAASGGILYRTSTVGFTSTVLSAYDLAGVQHCAGTPVVCQPLWTATAPGWSFSAPAVANGTVYVATPTGIFAFDAAGSVNCSGAPKTCTPRWQGTVPTVASSPVTVANGLVFVSAGGPRRVVGFDAGGSRNCTGTPKTCLPVWVANKAGPDVAVAKGILYTRTDAGLSAFDATGDTNCSGSGAARTCHRLWRYADDDCTGQAFPCTRIAPAIVVNGVLYRNWVDPGGSATLAAYDATGTTNCAGSPALCQPLRTWAGGGETAGPVLADGFVYTRGTNDEVQAFGLP